MSARRHFATGCRNMFQTVLSFMRREFCDTSVPIHASLLLHQSLSHLLGAAVVENPVGLRQLLEHLRFYLCFWAYHTLLQLLPLHVLCFPQSSQFCLSLCLHLRQILQVRSMPPREVFTLLLFARGFLVQNKFVLFMR